MNAGIYLHWLNECY